MDWVILLLILALSGLGIAYATLRRRHREADAALAELAGGSRPRFSLEPQRGLMSNVQAVADRFETLARQASEEAFNLRAILSGMVEGVMVTDENRVIRMVNDSFRELFHLEQAPIGQSVLVTLREAAIEEVVRSTIELRERQSHEVSVLGGTTVGVRFFAVNAVPVEDREGKANGALVVFHDITQLRQLETVRREFVSNVSHELRTPLSIFHGYVENLIDEPEMPLEDRKEVLEIMRKHSLRLNALLEDLLTLARLESKRIKFELVSIRVAPFLEQFADEWRDRLQEKDQALEVEASPDLPALPADLLRLEQVLSNLVDNASKYSPAGNLIRIIAAVEGPYLRLDVSDNGQGIPSSDLPHIFERFYRVEKARSRETGGTGLGLSIVKHIVALHGGVVEAASIYGKGTTVSVFLPLEDEMARTEGAKRAPVFD